MILQAGGSGFIGSNFYEVLDQDSIINFDLKPMEGQKSKYIQGDICKPEDFQLLNDYIFDQIIHLPSEN